MNDPASHSDEAWNAVTALDLADRRGQLPQLTPALDRLVAASQPVTVSWLSDRLTTMWGEFMASRPSKGPEALALWMAERIRLLGHLPHDILASAVDAAVQRSPHGFIPSIGEICTIAEPMALERRRQVHRLRSMVDAMADEETRTELARRRHVRAMIVSSTTE